jgi:hypothetical protein
MDLKRREASRRCWVMLLPCFLPLSGLVASLVLVGCFLFEVRPATQLQPYTLPGTRSPVTISREPVEEVRRPTPQVEVPDLGPLYQKYRGRIVITQRQLPSSKVQLLRLLDSLAIKVVQPNRNLASSWHVYYYAALRGLAHYYGDGPGHGRRNCTWYLIDLEKGPYRKVDYGDCEREQWEQRGEWSMSTSSGCRPGKQYQFRMFALIDPELDLSAENEIPLAQSDVFTLR